MTHDNRGHYAKKHSPDRKVKPEISDALKKQASDGRVSCAVAHKIAEDLKETPEEVGFTMDMLELRIAKCQMGLFGYTPKKKIVEPVEHVPQTLKNAIKGQLEDERLSCKAAWKIAEELGIKKMEVAAGCEALKIKIAPCQLGAF
jgi:hypothetical protein